jgi:HEAT repeat protein
MARSLWCMCSIAALSVIPVLGIGEVARSTPNPEELMDNHRRVEVHRRLIDVDMSDPLSPIDCADEARLKSSEDTNASLPALVATIASLRTVKAEKDGCLMAYAADRLVAYGANGLVHLAPLLKDSDPKVRFRTAYVLGETVRRLKPLFPPPSPVIDKAQDEWQAVPTLLASLLNDPERQIRAHAAWCLGDEMGLARWRSTKLVATSLVPLLEDADPYVRADAARALGNIRKPLPEAIPPLNRLLQDSSFDVREQAVWALSGMGELAAPTIESLLPRFLDRDPEVRARTAFVLGQIGRPAAKRGSAFLVAAVLQDDNNRVRDTALYALDRMGESSQINLPEMLSLLKDPDPFVQANAATIIGNRGEPAKASIPALIRLFSGHQDFVASRAARAIGRIGPTAIPLLTPLLRKSNDKWVRVSAIYALGEMGAAAVPTGLRLWPLMADADPDVRAAATKALEKIPYDYGGCDPITCKPLEDPDDWTPRPPGNDSTPSPPDDRSKPNVSPSLPK